VTARRVLVTGASGFIGSRALAPLVERGFDVHALSRSGSPGRDVSASAGAPGGQPAASAGAPGGQPAASAGAPGSQPAGAPGGLPAVSADPPGAVAWHAADLLDAVQRRALVAEVQATHLLHLAWYAEPGTFWAARENAAWVAATVGLVDEFAAAGGERATLAGTCAEYDWAAPQPAQLREDAPLRPATYYGICKDATRRVAEGLAQQARIELAWGRVFFLYGPGEDERRLVSSVARALTLGERAATGAGTQRRDFLHVDDVAGAFAAITDSATAGAVNIGSGEGVTVRHVVELVARAAGREDLLDIGALAPRPGDPDAIVADVARLRDATGFVPAIGLEQGIASTLAWWRAQLG
jgi:nucleoside-diphosphate-sugar epimerase